MDNQVSRIRPECRTFNPGAERSVFCLVGPGLACGLFPEALLRRFRCGWAAFGCNPAIFEINHEPGNSPEAIGQSLQERNKRALHRETDELEEPVVSHLSGADGAGRHRDRHDNLGKRNNQEQGRERGPFLREEGLEKEKVGDDDQAVQQARDKQGLDDCPGMGSIEEEDLGKFFNKTRGNAEPKALETVIELPSSRPAF